MIVAIDGSLFATNNLTGEKTGKGQQNQTSTVKTS